MRFENDSAAMPPPMPQTVEAKEHRQPVCVARRKIKYVKPVAVHAGGSALAKWSSTFFHNSEENAFVIFYQVRIRIKAAGASHSKVAGYSHLGISFVGMGMV